MVRNLKVGILDSTLREGEQTPGVNFTYEQRVEITKAIAKLEPSMIELGHPSVSKDIYNGIRTAVKLKREGEINSKIELVAHSRCVRDDIETASQLEVDRVAMFFGVSPIHLKAKHGVSPEKALQIIGESVELAKQHGVKVRLTAEDASRTSLDFLIKVAKVARDAGADRIGIADTVGVLNPLKTKELFRNLIEKVPGVEYDIHAHNDLGNAVANSLAAFEGGATIIHATINGLGERVGITPLQVIAVALKIHYGIEVVRLNYIQEASRIVEKYSGIQIPVNFPVSGEYAFVHKSGVHVAGILKDPETYEPFQPELIGRVRDYVIDKYTGRHALKARFEKLGVSLSDDDLMKILKKIKEAQGTKFFREAELLELAEEITGKVLKPRPPEQLEAVIAVKVDSNIYTTNVTRKLTLIEGVTEVMEITGDYDVIVKVKARDPFHLNQIVENIREIKGVVSTMTSLILKKI
jgi:2-isopropylmalate synthase